MQMKKIGKLALLLMLALAMVVMASCGSTTEDPVVEPEPEPDPIYNPLTHLEVNEEVSARAIVVSVDNHSDARPQAGLSSADIVYEVPAEGGISRYELLFYGEIPDTIGPVRSSRPYIIDIAREWDALFVHCGWSEDARKYLQSGVVDYLNELTYSGYFWRDKTSGRKAPHNLYTSGDNIYSFLADKSLAQTQDVREFLFYEDKEDITGEKCDMVYINYPYAKNVYQYNPETGLYYRSIGNTIQIDANTGEQISCANILVQRVTSRTVDSYGRLSIDMTAGGEAMLFTGGVVKTGTWSRAGKDEPTYFYDSDGTEWKLSPGHTWIQVCDGQVSVSYEDTLTPDESETVTED